MGIFLPCTHKTPASPQKLTVRFPTEQDFFAVSFQIEANAQYEPSTVLHRNYGIFHDYCDGGWNFKL